MGRSASTAGSVADIAPTAAGQVLRYDGTTTGFGTVGTAGIADGAITTAKIGDAQVTNAKILDGTITSNKLNVNTIISASNLPSSVKYNYLAGANLTGSEVFITGIPAEANKIFIHIWQMSYTTSSTNLHLKVGNTSIVPSGYFSSSLRLRDGNVVGINSTTTGAFTLNTAVYVSSGPDAFHYGTLVLQRIHPNSAGWIMNGELAATNGTMTQTNGAITIPSGTNITQISLNPTSGIFDSGAVFVWWEV